MKMYFDIILIVFVASASTHITTAQSITCNKVGLCQVGLLNYENYL